LITLKNDFEGFTLESPIILLVCGVELKAVAKELVEVVWEVAPRRKPCVLCSPESYWGCKYLFRDVAKFY
jgi:hypothetical protein